AFQAAAEETKNTCPISRLLAPGTTITMTAKLETDATVRCSIPSETPRGWRRSRHPLVAVPASESWLQRELPVPALGGPIVRVHVVDFGHRHTEHVESQRGADAGHGLAIAAEERGLVGVAPR